MEKVTKTVVPRGPDFKAIQIEYMLGGLTPLQTLFADGKVSREILKRAADALVARPGVDASDFADWVVTLAPTPSGRGPGRGAVKAGETRDFKVQEVKGSRFLRLPTPIIDKGLKVPCELSADGSKFIVHIDQAYVPVVKTDAVDTETEPSV